MSGGKIKGSITVRCRLSPALLFFCLIALFHFFFAKTGIELRAVMHVGQHSGTEPHPHPLFFYLD